MLSLQPGSRAADARGQTVEWLAVVTRTDPLRVSIMLAAIDPAVTGSTLLSCALALLLADILRHEFRVLQGDFGPKNFVHRAPSH